MRRLAALAAVLALGGAAAGAVAATHGGGQTGSSYRVDIVFDDARGLIPGQLVEVAGARVGTIQDVTLTPAHRARIEATIDPRFAPFRSDATCTIRPEGLLAENYVDCDPGSPRGRALVAHDGRAPTVPVTQTTEPVTLNDLFDIATVPFRDRLRVLVDELGVGLAGRGQDLNAILLRANPALGQARRVLAILRAQRRQLATAIDASDAAVARLAAHPGDVRAFIDRTAAVAERTAAHRGGLSESIGRLPPLLAQARPALRDLDAVAVNGTPLLDELRAAAPSLDRLSTDLGPFAARARPELARLERTLARGTRATRRSLPLVTAIARYVHASLPNARLAGQVFANLRDRGAIEFLLSFFYHGAESGARFDAVSHILPSRLSVDQCSQYASTPVAGCSANQPADATSAAMTRLAGFLLGR